MCGVRAGVVEGVRHMTTIRCGYCSSDVDSINHHFSKCQTLWELRRVLAMTKRTIRKALGIAPIILISCSSSAFALDPTESPDTADSPDATPIADSAQEGSDAATDARTEAFLGDSADAGAELGTDTGKGVDSGTETESGPDSGEVCTGKALGDDCMIAEPKGCCSGKCVEDGKCCGIGRCAP